MVNLQCKTRKNFKDQRSNSVHSHGLDQSDGLVLVDARVQYVTGIRQGEQLVGCLKRRILIDYSKLRYDDQSIDFQL